MNMRIVSDPRKEVVDHNLEVAINNLAEQTQSFGTVIGSDGDSSTAVRDVYKDEFFIINGVGYVAIQNIATGSRISEGINVVKKSLIDWLSERMSK